MKKTSQIVGLCLVVGVIVSLVIFVYGPTELFSDIQLTQAEVVRASIKGGAIACVIALVLIGGSQLEAWASTKGKRRRLFRNGQ